MTTPAEKDAMALAVLDAAAETIWSEMQTTRNPNPDAALREARAHLAARVGALTIERDALIELSAQRLRWLDTMSDRATRAEAELAAVREWLSKLESFVGPGALAYMRREFDAARGANK